VPNAGVAILVYGRGGQMGWEGGRGLDRFRGSGALRGEKKKEHVLVYLASRLVVPPRKKVKANNLYFYPSGPTPLAKA